MGEIYDKVKKLCKEKGVTVSAAEKELGFARGSLCKIDTHAPSLEKASKLAEYFNVDSSEFRKMHTITFDTNAIAKSLMRTIENMEMEKVENSPELSTKKKVKFVQVYRPVQKTVQSEYYHDNEVSEIADFLKQNEEYKVLFDTYRKIPKDQIDKIVEMINLMTRK